MKSSSAASAGDRAVRIFRSAVQQLDPEQLVAEELARQPPVGPVVLVALGKAAASMVHGARRALGSAIASECVVVPASEANLEPGWSAGTHPVPDAQSERAGRSLLAAVASAPPNRTVLALVSGGGSALAAVPANGIPLADKRDLLARIYAAGADIAELNTVRKHLSAIKGGRLAAAARGPVSSLVISDVVGDDLSAVASGPTVPDSTTFGQALDVVEARVGLVDVAASVRHYLERGVAGEIPESPKTLPDTVSWHLLAGIGALVDAAVSAATAEGLCSRVLSRELTGDVSVVAGQLVDAAGQLAPGECVIAGGETTIELPANPGRGGRCHHLALQVARALAGLSGISVLCAGSDGIDGNSGAAGALVDAHTWQRVEAAGLSPNAALEAFDSAMALDRVGASLVTGATGINHADLVIVLRD